jgi:hypothetical protein
MSTCELKKFLDGVTAFLTFAYLDELLFYGSEDMQALVRWTECKNFLAEVVTIIILHHLVKVRRYFVEVELYHLINVIQALLQVLGTSLSFGEPYYITFKNIEFFLHELGVGVRREPAAVAGWSRVLTLTVQFF